VTADHPSAHESALSFLNEASDVVQRRVAIIFGLFSDPKQPMPQAPSEMSALPQRDFVFSRHSFTTEGGIEVYGVCGRNLEAWQMLMSDLQPDSKGQPPKLVTMLNEAQHQVEGQDPLKSIAQTLNQGSAYVGSLLSQQQALKLVANLLVEDQV
jgi:hypothetical protein